MKKTLNFLINDKRGTVNGRENTGSGNSKRGESEGETKNVKFCHLFIYIIYSIYMELKLALVMLICRTM